MKPRENCIVCEEIIPRSNIKLKYKTKRRPQDITCSRKCSKIYGRVQKHIRDRIGRLRELRDLEKNERGFKK